MHYYFHKFKQGRIHLGSHIQYYRWGWKQAASEETFDLQLDTDAARGYNGTTNLYSPIYTSVMELSGMLLAT